MGGFRRFLYRGKRNRGVNLAITSPFDKGIDYIDNDMDRKLIEEMLARYYLEMRYTFFPDKMEMLRRWGWASPLARISTRALHKTLARDDLEDVIRNRQNIETVNIVKITPSTSKEKQYIAEMQVNTISDMGEYTSAMYRATMDFNYSPSYQSFFRDPINPYGLYFHRVSIKPM